MSLTPTLDAVLQALHDEVEDVVTSGVPIILDEEYLRDITAIEDLLKDNQGRLHFILFRPRIPAGEEAAQRGRFIETYDIEIADTIAVQESPNIRQTLRNEIESIRDKLRGNTAVFGTPEQFGRHQRLATAPTIEPTQFMGVACWTAFSRITVEAIEDQDF